MYHVAMLEFPLWGDVRTSLFASVWKAGRHLYCKPVLAFKSHCVETFVVLEAWSWGTWSQAGNPDCLQGWGSSLGEGPRSRKRGAWSEASWRSVNPGTGCSAEVALGSPGHLGPSASPLRKFKERIQEQDANSSFPVKVTVLSPCLKFQLPSLPHSSPSPLLFILLLSLLLSLIPLITEGEN